MSSESAEWGLEVEPRILDWSHYQTSTTIKRWLGIARGHDRHLWVARALGWWKCLPLESAGINLKLIKQFRFRKLSGFREVAYSHTLWYVHGKFRNVLGFRTESKQISTHLHQWLKAVRPWHRFEQGVNFGYVSLHAMSHYTPWPSGPR